MQFIYEYAKGAWEKAVTEFAVPIAAACTAAIRDAEVILKKRSRAAIGAAGFGSRWQNTLRTRSFPEGDRTSIDAAAFLWHKIPYAGVFQDGATIAGNPLLWLPLSSAPKRIGRNRFSAAGAVQAGVNLISMRSRTGRPLLGARVRLTRAQAEASDPPRLTLAKLKRGATGRGVARTIPLFVGVSSVKIRKRFDIDAEASRVRDMLPGLYYQHFKDE